jgi:hypothetical protein
MKKFLSLALLVTICLVGFNTAKAQFTDNFNDGDFTTNPTWVGNTADWMVNPALQLQSNNTVANSQYYLSTPSTIATSAQWEFFVKIDFNPSSANYIDVYLTSSASDLTNAAITGYFVRIGNTTDEISLYRKDAAGAVKIIDGADAVLNVSASQMKIRVTRNAANQWVLSRDLSGTGSSYVAEGTVNDATYTTSSFFGIYVKQSTSSFFQKHYFDDIEAKAYVPDVTPPAIQSVTALSPTTIDVLFNEPVDLTTSQIATNYSVNNGVGNPASAVRDASNSSLVHLTFATNFPNGIANTVTINGVKDLADNAIVNGTATFTFTVTPLVVQSVTALSPNTVDVLFNKPVDVASSQATVNYLVNNTVGRPVSATRDATNTALVHLTFAANFPNGQNNTITISNVKDLFGYTMTTATANFSFYMPQRYDAVIDEIFADPTPVVALPNVEFIEIKNTSGTALNLLGWKIASTSTTSGAFPSYVLPADSFLILTATSSAALFTPYGRVLGVTSFPALTNEGATLTLTSREGVTIHSVTYSDAWYNNVVKKEGGWSLEMVDTRNPCNGGNNWKASTDVRGGTPGTKNSVDGANPDQTGPSVIRSAATNSTTVVLTFSEPIDSTRGATAANYSISNGIGAPVSASSIGPAFNKVQLRLAQPLVVGTVYTVTVSNITDCSGNAISGKTVRLGLPSPIDSFGIIVNEVLFDPNTSGVDFVEIYNRSNKIYDLKELYLNNRSSSTLALGAPKQVSTDNLLIFPGDFYVLSPNGETVKQQFVAKNPDNFIDIASFPTYANDKGYVVLQNAQGQIVDELDYTDKWHFALIDNPEGISLERIDYDKPTQDQSNWHSAASTSGFGTPSYQNSQYRTNVVVQGDVTVTPKVFSPDNDGFDDFALINYQLQTAGYVANITIYDAAGRPVKVLAKNATLGLTGSFRWDGLNDKQLKVPIGAYVVYTEFFNLEGKRRTFKNTIVVARKF